MLALVNAVKNNAGSAQLFYLNFKHWATVADKIVIRLNVNLGHPRYLPHLAYQLRNWDKSFYHHILSNCKDEYTDCTLTLGQ